MKKARAVICSVAFLAVGATVVASALQPQDTPRRDPASSGRERSSQRFREIEAANDLVGRREFVVAKALLDACVQDLSTNPGTSANDRIVSGGQLVTVRRTLARLHRDQRNIEAAKVELAVALAELDANPQLATRMPICRHLINMDAAEIAAFEDHDSNRAIALWETVVADRQRVPPSLALVAMKNSASLSASQGQFADGIAKIDRLLDSQLSETLSRPEVMALKVSKASYLWMGEDRGPAHAFTMDAWSQFQDIASPELCAMVVRCAQGTPVPARCEVRKSIVVAVHTAIERNRLPDGTMTPMFDKVEKQLATAIWDMRACEGIQELVAWATPRRVTTRQPAE